MKNSVSALMCYYNGEKPENLNLALESLVNQTQQPEEVILVRDGPVKDELSEVVASYSERFNNFKHILIENNSGHGKARERGLAECSFELVAICDSDDICHPERIETQRAIFFKDPKVSVVSSNLAEFKNSIDNIVSIKSLPENDADLKRLIKWKCPINQPSVMFRLHDVNSVGGYVHWYNNEDYYLWIRMAAKGFKFHNTPKPLVYFRTDENVFERRGGWKYFVSELKIQKLMLSAGLSNFGVFTVSVVVRFIVQVVLTNRLRMRFYEVFLREKGEISK
ncbi:glycosyltransferase [Ferrimonas sediminicola]|nr:glycosyltransferase [Ferrimonas sediminicola]